MKLYIRCHLLTFQFIIKVIYVKFSMRWQLVDFWVAASNPLQDLFASTVTDY